MDEHMEELFEDAQLFIDSELSRTEEYNRCFSANLALEEAMKTQFGPEAHKLLMEFLDSYSEIERFNCLYYFYQGCLTAKQELEGQKSPDAKASGLFLFPNHRFMYFQSTTAASLRRAGRWGA